MDAQKKIIVPLLFTFTIFSGSLVATNGLLAKWGINHYVLLMANLLFFLVGLLVFFMQKKALYNSNPNVFVRSVMGGMLIKMFVVITAVIVYRLSAGTHFSKVSVFAAMLLYLIYLAVEVGIITKLNKQKHG